MLVDYFDRNVQRYWGQSANHKVSIGHPEVLISIPLILLSLIHTFGRRVKFPFYCKLLHMLLQGPNQVWHIDGNDKLKKFGFAIHGCIDGWV